ncbi:hypothetical protein GCM10025879_20280 [Leuconostoc litchii]|uniref:hypothetical protein n=1 Tax=Leuconostoc litchii TaxID=1981069 RepID=UPI0023E9BA37|nr:hypothetical protein [Leuconostoc litchii]GMA68782.1 hypothetical protein GCM10025879_00280 [Leuconostoc litchii]GMA70782.1 hypothetical protein GCM10025879_20280 [Leuconostoc litchii]
MDTGQALIQGRLVEILSAESITLPSNTSGKIVVTVDLTKQNDVSGNAGDSSYSVTVNQAYISVITSGTITQDDLNNGGYIYQLPIASFVSTATTATTTNIQSLFSDTGWLPLSLPSGTGTNGGSGWAQYRVKNNMMMISFYNINCVNNVNHNQIVVIPESLQPVGDNLRYFSIHNYNANTGYAYPVMATVQSKGHGAVVYGMWNYSEVANLTGATGTIQYPIG